MPQLPGKRKGDYRTMTPIYSIIALVVLIILRGHLFNLLIMAKNNFNYTHIDTSDKYRVDCSNKSPMWMHSVERTDTKSAGNIIMSFGIMIAFIGFVVCLFVAIDLYPKAYPAKKPVVKIYSKK